MLFASALLATALWAGTAGAAGARPAPRATASTDSSLAGVACPSTTVCVAVGFATLKGVEVPFAEVRSSKAWTVQTLPDPTGFDRGQLYAVACPTTTSCAAVGDFDNSTGAQLMLAYGWNGKAWTVEATPAPADYYGQQLNGIACPSASACYAVGTYFESSGDQVQLAEYWNGKTWATQTLPSGTPKFLMSVACTSATACTAVGSYAKGAGNDLTLAEDWNGTAWAAETAPNPKGAQGTYPATIACSSASSCTSVGYYQTSTAYLGEAESWNGKAWTVESTPAPASGDSGFLSGVACPAAAECMSVGYVQDASGNDTTLAESWTGKAWATTATVNPKSSSTEQLFGVACPSATSCTAVGTWTKGNDSYALAEHWNGKAWAEETIPNG